MVMMKLANTSMFMEVWDSRACALRDLAYQLSKAVTRTARALVKVVVSCHRQLLANLILTRKQQ